MERLTNFITPVGMCMTTLNSMKHYMPCVKCRHNAQIKTDSNGKMYTEKFSFCDTCELKMLFNRLKEYEDLEEQGLLLRLPCKVGAKFYRVILFCSMSGREDKDVFRPTRSDCDYWCDCNCNYPCDKEYRIVENTFTSLEEILNHTKDVGVSYFLTKEEAEHALAKMKEV